MDQPEDDAPDPVRDAVPERTAAGPVGQPALSLAAERALDDLLTDARLAAPHQLPGLFEEHARRLGVDDVQVYLADLQQDVLVPFVGPCGPAQDATLSSLHVDGTLAGRCYQHVEVLTQPVGADRQRVHLPLVDGSDRLGVFSVRTSDRAAATDPGSLLRVRLHRLSAVAAEVLMTKTLYGDTIVRLRQPVGAVERACSARARRRARRRAAGAGSGPRDGGGGLGGADRHRDRRAARVWDRALRRRLGSCSTSRWARRRPTTWPSASWRWWGSAASSPPARACRGVAGRAAEAGRADGVRPHPVG